MAQNRNGSEPLVVCGEKGAESYAGYGVVRKKRLELLRSVSLKMNTAWFGGKKAIPREGR